MIPSPQPESPSACADAMRVGHPKGQRAARRTCGRVGAAAPSRPTRRLIPALVALAGLLACPAPGWAQTGSVKRFALLIGANDGGPDRTLLRYATKDARRVGRVLRDLGGITGTDGLVLDDPDVPTVRAALNRLARLVGAARPKHRRVELLVYYSGHSDEEGLLLGRSRFAYDELRAALSAVGADVRVAVLDSCSSGAMTRRKGGVRRPAFLTDESTSVRGHAYLTSSSADEAAQESDRLGGSYFTHALVTGLLGAADASSDGRVTLSEAYDFAFRETVARTAKTQFGAQHPAYEIQLMGTGELVLTEVRKAQAVLALDGSVRGRVFVRDGAGALVAELAKAQGTLVELALPEGRYRVLVQTPDDDAGLLQADVALGRRGRERLAAPGLRRVARDPTARRGPASPRRVRPTVAQATLDEALGNDPTASADPYRLDGTQARGDDEARGGSGQALGATRPPPAPPAEDPLDPWTGATRATFALSLFPGLGTAGRRDDRVVKRFSLNAMMGRAAGIDGAELGLLANLTAGRARGFQAVAGLNIAGGLAGVQWAGVGNIVRGEAAGWQSSNLFNWVSGPLYGYQQTAGLNMASGGGWGLQVASVANWVRAPFVGVQLGGVVNGASDRLSGGQLGPVNVADGLTGLQLGLVNVGGHVRGLQMGLLNVATELDGAQVGLINIAGDADDGATIGLLGIADDGHREFTAWTADSTLMNVGFKLGSPNLYTLFSFGVHPWNDEVMVSGALGLGLHIEVEPVFIDVEAVSQIIGASLDGTKGDVHLLQQLRVGLGYRFSRQFAVVLGASANLLLQVDSRDTLDLGPMPFHEFRAGRGERMRLSPGVFVGVQI